MVIRISGTPSTVEGIMDRLRALQIEEQALYTRLEDLALGAKSNKHIELQNFVEFEAKKRGYTLAEILFNSRCEPLVSIRHEIIYEARKRKFNRPLVSSFFSKDYSCIRYIERKFKGTLKLKCRTPKSSSELVAIRNQEKIQQRSL